MGGGFNVDGFRHFGTYAIVTFRKVGRWQDFAQIGIYYTRGSLCKYKQRSPDEIQTPSHCNMIGRSMTASWPVLSPSINYPLPSSFCTFIPSERKFGACFVFSFSVSLFIYFFLSPFLSLFYCADRMFVFCNSPERTEQVRLRQLYCILSFELVAYRTTSYR